MKSLRTCFEFFQKKNMIRFSDALMVFWTASGHPFAHIARYARTTMPRINLKIPIKSSGNHFKTGSGALLLKVARIAEPSRASGIPSLMEQGGVSYHSLCVRNWPDDYPYCPEVRFAVAHCDTAVLLHYQVREQGAFARTVEDHGPVWSDSCVEFFVMPDVRTGRYYNVECNCIGTLHLAAGKDRHERLYASSALMSEVERWTSLTPAVALEETEEVLSWEVALRIPLACLSYPVEDAGDAGCVYSGLSGKRMKANFYKCGGSGSRKHYLSWAPIRSETPDFHRPECFEDLFFE